MTAKGDVLLFSFSASHHCLCYETESHTIDACNNIKVTEDTAPLVQWCWRGPVSSEKSLRPTNPHDNSVFYKWIVKDRMATELTVYLLLK